MDAADYNLLLDYVLACPIMQTKSSLTQVCTLLPNYIRLEVKFSNTLSSQREDVAALLNTCLKTRNGVAELVERISFFEAETIAFEQLQTFLEQLADKSQTLSTVANPYRGLETFRPEHRHFFFGRERDITELLEKLNQHPLVTVIGNSGSGKSSLVFAGLVPKLQDAGWNYLEFRPGSTPMVNLSMALATNFFPAKEEIEVRMEKAGLWREKLAAKAFTLSQLLAQRPVKKPLVVVVDQFEELFTLCQDAQERQQFFECLLPAFSSLEQVTRPATRLVITLRSDFLTPALAYRALADVLNGKEADLKLGPLSEAELIEVIEKPATLQGATFAEGLVQTILRDVQARPGELALLEFALTELWDKRSVTGQLTLVSYAAIGGVEQALANYATNVYQRFEPGEQGQLRYIFTQLVQPGQEGGIQDTRRIATRLELGAEKWELVSHLASTRLIVTGNRENKTMLGVGEATVELAHEALIRRWNLLQNWMQEDREFRNWQERLRANLSQWQEKQADPEALLRGRVLAEAAEWGIARGGQLSQPELAYIEASQKQRDELRRAGERRRRRQWQLALGVITALTILAALALINFMAASTQTIEANNAKATVGSQLVVSNNDKLTIGAQATAVSLEQAKTLQKLRTSQALLLTSLSREKLNQNPGLALLLALQANSFEATLQTDAIVRESLRALPNLKGYLKGAASNSVFSPDGKLIAISSASTIVLWDVATVAPLFTLNAEADAGELSSLPVFSPDSKTLTSLTAGGSVIIWDVPSGKGSLIPAKVQARPDRVTFSPTGKLLAINNRDGINLLDVASGTTVYTYTSSLEYVIDTLKFSPDEKTLIVVARSRGATSSEILLLDVASGKVRHTLKAAGVRFGSLAVSLDGKNLAIAMGTSATCQTIVWDVSSGVATHSLQCPVGVYNLAFSASNHFLASAFLDGTVTVWDLTTTTATVSYTVKDTYVSINSDGTSSPLISPDGQFLLSATSDASSGFITTLRDVETGAIAHSFGVSRSSLVTFSPDSQRFISGSDDGAVILWDVKGSTNMSTFRGQSGKVYSLAFSPDSQLLASGSISGTVILWDVATRNILHNLTSPGGVVSKLAFSPDSQYLVSTTISDPRSTLLNAPPTDSATTENTVTVWNVRTGRAVYSLKKPGEGTLRVKISADSPTLFFVFIPAYSIMLTESRAVVHDIATGNIVRAFRGQFSMAEFSPDGKLLATVSDSESKTRSLTIWDVATGTTRYVFKNQKERLSKIFFSPDNKLLASLSDNNSQLLVLYDMETGEVVRSFKAAGSIYVQFSADGKFLTSVRDSGNEGLFFSQDIATGNIVRSYKNPTGQVYNLALSLDNKLAVIGSDTTLSVHDIATGSIRNILKGHTAAVLSKEFSPDGKLLATGSADTTVILWELDITALRQKACELVRRNLTWQEWQQYVGGTEPYQKTCPAYPLPTDLPQNSVISISTTPTYNSPTVTVTTRHP